MQGWKGLWVSVIPDGLRMAVSPSTTPILTLAANNNIAVVHNGIIENYLPLKEELVKNGHIFRSETDTEVIAHLLEEYYNTGKDIKRAMIETVNRLEGSYAFVAMFANGTLSCARLDEPLVIGISDNTYYASSDVLGFLQYTDQAMFLDNQDMAIIDKAGISIVNFSGEPVTRGITKVAWELADANKGEFAHYTIKEIFEQRTSVKAATYQDEHKINAFCDSIVSASNILVTGSGTSYHTSLIISMIGSRFLKKRFEPVMASEFQYNMDSIDKDTVIIAISQSGETADVTIGDQARKGSWRKNTVHCKCSNVLACKDCRCFAQHQIRS